MDEYNLMLIDVASPTSSITSQQTTPFDPSATADNDDADDDDDDTFTSFTLTPSESNEQDAFDPDTESESSANNPSASSENGVNDCVSGLTDRSYAFSCCLSRCGCASSHNRKIDEAAVNEPQLLNDLWCRLSDAAEAERHVLDGLLRWQTAIANRLSTMQAMVRQEKYAMRVAIDAEIVVLVDCRSVRTADVLKLSGRKVL